MYAGQVIETASTTRIFNNPRHPYTRRLIDAVPQPDPARRRSHFARMEREIPSPVRKVDDPPQKVELFDVGNGHLVAAV